MASSGNVIGKISVLQGHAYFLHNDGSKTDLKIGDAVHEGDIVVTDPGALVELGFTDGHNYVVSQNETVTVDASVFNNSTVDPTAAALNAQTGQLDELNAVIASGGNLDQLFDAAEAGITGGVDANSAHSFVQLLRIVETVSTEVFVQSNTSTSTPTVIPGEATLYGVAALPDVTLSSIPTINGTLANSNTGIVIGGHVSPNVPVGDAVTLTVGGNHYTGTVLPGGSYVIDVPASTLAAANADTVLASVSIPDGRGGVVTGTASQTYTVELAAPPISVSINPVTTINSAMAASAALITISGKVSSNVPIGDTVTLTVDSQSYTATVQTGGNYSIGISSTVLAAGGSGNIVATVASTDAAGNTANASATQPYAVDTITPATPAVAIRGADSHGDLSAANISGGDVNVTITLNAAGQSTLQTGGNVQVTVNDNNVAQHLTLSLNSTGQLVDASNHVYSYTNGVITLPEAAPGNAASLHVTAVQNDINGNNSASATAAAMQYMPATIPAVAIAGAINGEINSAAVGSTINTAVSLTPAGQATLASGGSLQITINDNGTISNLNVHLNGAGSLIDANGTPYNYNAGVMTISAAAPGSGHSITFSATETDISGISSGNASSSATEYTALSSVPSVAIGNAVAGELSTTAVTGGNVNATVTLSSNGQAVLASGGNVQVSVNDAGTVSNLNLHLNAAGALVDASGTSYIYSNGVITLTEAAPGSGNTIKVTATETDATATVSVPSSASANEYTPITSQPATAITGAVNGELDAATTGGSVNATVTLDAAGQAVLNSGGSVQISVNDAGAPQTLVLHLNGSGALIDGLGTAHAYNGGVLTLTEPAPGSGNTIAVSATETDVTGVVSASSSSSANEYTPASAVAPMVAIVGAISNTLTNATLDGLTTVNATVTLNTAQQNTVSSGGSLQITVSDAGVTQTLNLTQSGTSLVDTLGHTYSYAGGVLTLIEAAPGSGNTLSITALVTDAAAHSTPSATATATETITLPDTPSVALLANGLVGNYYGVNDQQISSPHSGFTPLGEVDAYLLTKTTANSTTAPTTFPSAVIAPATASFIATEINYGINTTSTSPTPSNETISNNLGTSGNLANFLNVVGTSNPDTTNFQTLSNYGTTSQAIITMTGVVALPTLGNGQEYALKIFADDGYQVFVDGNLVSTVAGNQAGRADYFYFTAQATAGNLHTIQILYWDQGGVASIQASIGTILTTNQPSSSSAVPTLATPLAILTPTQSGEVTATVTLDAKNQSVLTNGGTIHITESNGSSLVLHQNGAGKMVDAGGLIYTYVNGVVYIPVATSSAAASISASVVDQYNYASGTAHTEPSISFTSDVNHDGYLSAPELNGASAISALITLNSAAQSTLGNGGTVQINVNDNGSVDVLNLHLNSAGVLVNSAGISTAEYSYAAGVISLNEPASSNGHSISISASTIDNAGNTSPVSTVATALQDALDSPTVMVLDPRHATVALDGASQAALAISGSTLTVTASDGSNLVLHENTSGQLVDASNAVHSFANGILPLNLTSSTSAPVVNVTAALTDSHGVTSFASAATLVNAGSNSLAELAGGDTFIFTLGANGTSGAPHMETISAFNSNAAASGGDVLNLADLLTGISASSTAATLSNYLHFTEVSNGTGGFTTTVQVSSSGAFSSGYSAAQDTLQIVLSNTDLLHSGGATQSDTQIIQHLLNQHKLVE